MLLGKLGVLVDEIEESPVPIFKAYYEAMCPQISGPQRQESAHIRLRTYPTSSDALRRRTERTYQEAASILSGSGSCRCVWSLGGNGAALSHT